MKLQAKILESVDLKVGNESQSIIVQFLEDKDKQHFEVWFHNFDPYRNGLRKWDIWELSIKFKSDVFTDPKTLKKSYFTYLICTKANPIIRMGL
ncbi:MAG: hypothetical protein LC112_15320 [Flavobacteriales bacterium]|nr:hypothetical protein [Flavobacteriales bacterium]